MDTVPGSREASVILIRDPLGKKDLAIPGNLLGVPPEKRHEAVREATRRIFGWIGENSDHLDWLFSEKADSQHPLLAEEARTSSLTAFRKALRTLLQVDQQATQGVILDFATPGKEKNPVQGWFADLAFGFPEMASPDTPISVGPDGTLTFTYCDRIIHIPPESIANIPNTRGLRFSELMAGFLGMMVDEEGNPVSLLHLNLLNAKPEETPEQGKLTTTAIPLTMDSFNSQFYYGVPVSMEEIRDCIADTTFYQEITSLFGRELNLAALPLYARVRLRNMLKNSNYSQAVRNLCSHFQTDCLELFQLFHEDELYPLSDMAGYLIENNMDGLAAKFLRGASIVGDFAPELAGGKDGKSLEIERLLEIKIRQQLSEAGTIFQANKENLEKITAYDWEMIAYSMEMLGMTAKAALAIAREKPFPFDMAKMKMPPSFLIDVFDFSSRHPEAKTISQTLFDLTMSVFIARQDEADYHGEIPTMKSEFYRQFTEMYRNAPTTDNRDVDRTFSLIANHVSGKKDLQENGISILFGGCGKCERFEGPLIRKLEDAGVKMVRRIGVDINDHTDEIPDDLAIQFRQANLAASTFEIDKPVDVLVLPWSMINDFVGKRNLLEGLQIFRKLVKKDGLIIFDVPLPVGVHSYAKTIKEQADRWGVWGLMERDFAEGQSKVSSIFDIMHIHELTLHLLHAGLVPNIPWEFDRLQALCAKIEKDDSPLAARHKSGEDADALAYSFWQAKGYNRATISARVADLEEVSSLTGLSPSILVRRAFPSPRKG